MVLFLRKYIDPALTGLVCAAYIQLWNEIVACWPRNKSHWVPWKKPNVIHPETPEVIKGNHLFFLRSHCFWGPLFRISWITSSQMKNAYYVCLLGVGKHKSSETTTNQYDHLFSSMFVPKDSYTHLTESALPMPSPSCLPPNNHGWTAHNFDSIRMWVISYSVLGLPLSTFATTRE